MATKKAKTETVKVNEPMVIEPQAEFEPADEAISASVEDAPEEKVAAPAKKAGVNNRQVMATCGFYDLACKTQRTKGETWETTPERAETLRACSFVTVL